MELTSESGPLLVGWQRALAEVDRLHRLFCELVPWGGSEFAGNPDAVVAEVQRELTGRLQSVVTANIEVHTLRAENERLCSELAAEQERVKGELSSTTRALRQANAEADSLRERLDDSRAELATERERVAALAEVYEAAAVFRRLATDTQLDYGRWVNGEDVRQAAYELDAALAAADVLGCPIAPAQEAKSETH